MEEKSARYSRRHGVKTLVYFELHDDMYEAIQRESTSRNGTVEIRLGPRFRGDDDLAPYFFFGLSLPTRGTPPLVD